MTSPLDQLQRHAAARLQWAARPFSGYREDTTNVEINIETGLQAGTSIQFQQPRITIGSGLEDDVMLLDDDAAGTAIAVELETSVFGTLAGISGHHAGLTLNGTPEPAHSEIPPQRLPCTMQIGDVLLKISNTQDKTPKPRGRIWLPLVLVFLGAGFLATGAPLLMSFETRSALTFKDVSERISTTRVLPSGQVQTLAADRIAETRLANYLVVQTHDTGSVGISGTIPAKLMPQWRQIRQDLDRASGGAPILSSVMVAPIIKKLPPIAAIQLGATPRIFFTTGRQARVGDHIADGWQIDAIERRSLNLSRGDETVVIDF